MDKELIRKRFARAADTYCRKADVQRNIAQNMLGLTERFIPADMHRRVLEVGCGTGMFTRMYLRHFTPQKLWLNDICGEVSDFFSDLGGPDFRFIAGDAENTDLPGRLDIVFSCSAIQWFEEPENFLIRCGSLLSSGGYIAVSTFGKENMHEISSITGFSLAYRSVDELRHKLKNNYEILYAGEELSDMTFDSPLDLLKHLKETGVTGIESRRWTKGMLSDFCSRYSNSYSDENGKVHLTYHPIYMILRKKLQDNGR